MKSFKKLLSWKSVFLFVASLCILFVGYLALDWKNIQIDRYNFEQLEKAKPILESIPANAPKFYSLKQFNEQYKANIQPIENCYYVSNDNGKEKYIFGFQLESLTYNILYYSTIYSFKKYDIPVQNFCGQSGNCTDDMNLNNFRYIISHSCKE